MAQTVPAEPAKVLLTKPKMAAVGLTFILFFGFFIFLLVEFITQKTKDSPESTTVTPTPTGTITPTDPTSPILTPTDPTIITPTDPSGPVVTPTDPSPPIVTPVPVTSLDTISAARAYFDEKASNNLLLVSATWKDTYIELTFENTPITAQLKLDLVSTFKVSQDNWRAYVTYTDTTNQNILYQGATTLDIPTGSVALDPFTKVPNAALLTFSTKVPGKIKVTIKGRNAASHDLVHQFKNIQSDHKVPILGLYANYVNQVIVSLTDASGTIRASNAFQIVTPTVPAKFGVRKVVKASTYPEPLFYSIDGIICDEQGYVRWYLADALTTQQQGVLFHFPLAEGLFSQMQTGNIIQIVYNMLGKEMFRFNVPNFQHHETIEKEPGGNLLVASHVTAGIDTQDAIFEIDRTTGEIVKQWDLRNYFDETRPIRDSNTRLDPADWLHINAITYDPKDNTLLLSSRNQCFFAKIGYDDGTVKWIAGYHDNWVAPYTNYLLTPTNFDTSLHPDQDWTWLQHAPYILPNGNIMVFDNGGTKPGFTNNPNTEIFDLTGTTYFLGYGGPPPPGQVRGVEYKIDPVAMTITKVWEHTDFPTLMNCVIGSIRPIDDDTVFIGYGELNSLTLIKKSTKEKLFHIQTHIFFYRSNPVNLYDGY